MLVWSASSTCHRDHSQSTNTFCFQKLKTPVCCRVVDSPSLAPCPRVHVAQLGFAGENGKYPLSAHGCYRTLYQNRKPSRAQSRHSQVQTDRHSASQGLHSPANTSYQLKHQESSYPFLYTLPQCFNFHTTKDSGLQHLGVFGPSALLQGRKMEPNALPQKLKPPVGQTQAYVSATHLPQTPLPDKPLCQSMNAVPCIVQS